MNKKLIFMILFLVNVFAAAARQSEVESFNAFHLAVWINSNTL